MLGPPTARRARQPEDPEARGTATPPPRHIPLWVMLLTVAALLGAGVLLGWLGGADSGTDTDAADDPGLLLNAAEEEATISALVVHAQTLAALADLQAVDDPFATPGADQLGYLLDRHTATLRDSIDLARHTDAGEAREPALRAWVTARDHDVLVSELSELAEAARTLHLLGALHQTLLGEGAIDRTAGLNHAKGVSEDPSQDRFARTWATALLRHHAEGGADRAIRTGRWRAAQAWTDRAAEIDEPSVAMLRLHLGMLHRDTVRNLFGHPVAGPAILDLVPATRQSDQT